MSRKKKDDEDGRRTDHDREIRRISPNIPHKKIHTDKYGVETHRTNCNCSFGEDH